MSEELQFSDEELAELRTMFFEQATEVIESLGGLILRVERDPGDAEALRSIRRAVHTLKGDSTAFGFVELTQLAHRYEDALDRVGENQDVASRHLIDLLLAGSDTLAEFIKYYQGLGPLPDTTPLILGLEALSESLNTVPAAPPVETESIAAAPVADMPPAKKRRPRNRAAANSTPRRRAKRQPAEPAAGGSAATETSAALERATPPKPEADLTGKLLVEEVLRQDARSPGKAAGQTLRVESERIDSAMNLVGELIIQRSMIASLAAEVEAAQRGNESVHQLVDAVALLGRTLSELQESVMCMRLVAIDQVFRRFPRVVRDASIKLEKPLRLEVSGGETEIDKSIVEVISDPLIHLIRNACDHGIEAPAVRLAAGKPAEGLIKLTARRAGNQIAVEVEDDGGGMDPERIAAKAIQKGVVSAAEVNDWTEQQKIGLIFAPGFSTAEKISDMSGRGVGLDVVKSTVDELGGSVNITSTIGQGSRFTVKLPLTMAIVRAMLFETAGQRFALPLDGIREITSLRPDETKTVNGREVLRLRDHVLPLIRVDEALGLRLRQAPVTPKRNFVFVLDMGDGRTVGLAVERLHGEQELVLKTVDEALTRSEVVAGASILGDGQVVLILDPYATIERARLGWQGELSNRISGTWFNQSAATGPH
jgi:two-component system chemotaxis sensor kinase CheA